jgi:uncharacterized repeat protein (TIGR03837 family)
MTPPARCDLFCRVVDNYGDVGVCWRLARQFAAEHGIAVRLWIDRPQSLHRLCPAADPAARVQRLGPIEVCAWTEDFPAAEPGDLVIEAFGCRLPARFETAMAARTPPPVWINLEYLSAEDWVRGCHGLPSPHPSLPLLKHFFFPGFAAGTGGVICEHTLTLERRQFLMDADARQSFWRTLGVPDPQPGERRISLFAYPNPALAGLLEAWCRAPAPVTVLVPAGEAIALDVLGTAPGARVAARGNLTLRSFDFLDQRDYDRLLWACDCNFVRGEDSFVRAQLARRPFVWQIYPQAQGAHWPKLAAFLDRYAGPLEPGAAAALRGFWLAWNRGADGTEAAAAWPAFESAWPMLGMRAEAWADDLERLGDLAGNLVNFVSRKL